MRARFINGACHKVNGERGMSQLAKSKILEEMIIEFRKKGFEIPPNVMSDLKSARTLMKVLDADSKGRGEIAPQVDVYLETVEAYLITEAGNLFSAEKIEAWLKKLELASCDACVTVVKPKEESRFISGVPRDQKWIRVQPIASLPPEKLKQLIKETNLQFREEQDGHLIVYGSQENISKFVKNMTTKNGQNSA